MRMRSLILLMPGVCGVMICFLMGKPFKLYYQEVLSEMSKKIVNNESYIGEVTSG